MAQAVKVLLPEVARVPGLQAQAHQILVQEEVHIVPDLRAGHPEAARAAVAAAGLRAAQAVQAARAAEQEGSI